MQTVRWLYNNKKLHITLALLIVVFSQSVQLLAQEQAIVSQSIQNRTLIRLAHPNQNIKAIAKHANIKLLSKRFGIYQLSYNKHETWLNEYKQLNENEHIASIQFDFKINFRQSPNDSLYHRQQNNLDRMNFPEAWNTSTGGKTIDGSPIVVAVLDGGFNIAHPDLIESIWVNTSEIPNDGIDNDNNGFIDDVHGWNFQQQQGQFNNNQHGTQVIGILGAAGNNETGISGTNWESSLMLFSIETVADIIGAYDYIIAQRQLWQDSNGTAGALIVATNASFGIEGRFCRDFPVWGEMYDHLGDVGILTVASAANRNWNADNAGDMPTSCVSDFIIGVTNIGEDDRLWRSAAWGPVSIDLGATGQGSYSTSLPNSYAGFGGTSAAAPYITGAIALLYSMPCDIINDLLLTNPKAAALLMRRSILRSTKQLISLENRVSTSGMLDVAAARDYLLNFCEASTTEQLEIVNIYPNPSSGGFYLEFSDLNATKHSLTFINASGQVVRRLELDENAALPASNFIRTQGLANGVYILELTNHETTTRTKIIISR